MSQPQRREQRRTHLDASVVPMEQALLARAGHLSADVGASEIMATVRKQARIRGATIDEDGLARVLADVLAHEYREMADELHWH